MPSIYDAIDVKGVMKYRRDKRFIAKDKIPQEVLEAITLDNMVDENGLVIVDNKSAELNEVSPEDRNDTESKEEDKPTENTDETETKAPADAPTQTTDDVNADGPAIDPNHETAIPDVEAGPTNVPLDKQDGYTPGKEATKKSKATAPKFVSKVPQSRIGMGFPRKNGKTVDIFDQETPHTHIKLVGGYTVPLSTESFNTRTEKEIEDRLVQMGYELIDFTKNENAPEDGLTDESDDDDGLTDDRP